MLKQVLSSILSSKETAQVYSAFDQIGDIVIIKIPDGLVAKKTLIAETILNSIKTCKSVFAQVSPVQGDFRVRQLEFLAGENRTLTYYREHGCRFRVDVAKTYFSPRLSTERQRIAKMVGNGETVVNMFAGVGTYSIIMARMNKTCFVYNIDSNQTAAELCQENAKLNRVHERVMSICGDAAKVVKSRLAGKADRVLMPLPERAKEFVEPAVLATKPTGGIIHYYAHIKTDSKKAALEQGFEDSDLAFAKFGHKVLGARVVREVGPRLYQIVSDVLISKR